MKEILKEKIEDIQQQLWDIREKMYHNSELGDEEFASMELLTNLLRENQ